MTFEKKLEKLSQIVEQVEDAQTPLDKAISLYKEGISLVSECGEALRVYEQEISMLQKTADGFALKPFSV